MFSKEAKPYTPTNSAKEELLLCQPIINNSKMPLPSAVKGNSSINYKRNRITFQKPNDKQNEIELNLQPELIRLAFSGCCTRAKYNHRTRTCEGINCLKAAFTTSEGDFDFLQAKDCFMDYFKEYRNKNTDGWKMWAYEEFLKCCLGLDESGNILHSFTLAYGPPSNKKRVYICRTIWAYFMGPDCTKFRMQIFSENYKKQVTPEGSLLTSKADFGDSTMHATSIEEINKIYVEAGIPNDDPNMIKLGNVRRAQMETFLWFRDHFDLVGDPQPNKQQVHLDKIEKSEIYSIYVNEIGKTKALSYPSWTKFWNDVFPEVRIKEWKSVTGKCEFCGYINAGRRTVHSQEELAAFRKLHILHKGGYFMLERCTYHMRRKEALEDNTILSGIVDIMDNSHCQCPYEAGQNTFKNAISQGICGFLNHGAKKLTIYRTTGLIHKGSNLTIYVINDQLELYLRKYNRFPRKLYLQMDGGAENANETVIAWLELLVARNLVPEIYFTRLPTGHTHEDIDAMFGHIWSWFRSTPCLTLEEYRRGVIDCFADGEVKAELEDIFIIPNYFQFLKNKRDDLERWAKKQLTVHQFYISRVECSVYFPLGVRTVYRDYVSHKVVELRKTEKVKATTRIGQLTGYDPVTHYSRWYPDETSIPGRSVNGFYLLHVIPDSHPTIGISPVNFDNDSIAALKATQNSILNSSYFKVDSPEREWWVKWFRETLPQSLLGDDYIKDHTYKQPLNAYLSGSVRNVIPMEYLRCVKDMSLANTEFEYPLDILSMATPHVSTEWMKHTIPPRQYKYCSPYLQQLTTTFEGVTKSYYKRYAEKMTITALHEKIKRNVDENGRHPALKGTKAELVAKIFEMDYVHYVNLYHPIKDTSDQVLIDNLWAQLIPFGSKAVVVPFRDIMSLRPECQMSYEAFVASVDLFNRRDALLCTAFNQHNDAGASTERRLKSYIVHPSAAGEHMCASQLQGSVYSMGVQVANLPHILYIPIRLSHCVIAANFTTKAFMFFSVRNAPKVLLEKKAQSLLTRFQDMLHLAGLEYVGWQLLVNDSTILLEQDIYPEVPILAIICHVMQQLPIYITKENLKHFRANLALALCKDSMFML